MRIIITGAGGFVGKNLLLGLPRDSEILALDRAAGLESFIRGRGLDNVRVERGDLGDSNWLNGLAGEWGGEADAVVYLAGNGDPARSVGRPGEDLRDGPLALINFFSTFRARLALYFSSGAVYDGLRGPVSPASRLDPRLPYAVGKLASEHYIKFFQKEGRIGDYVILRFFGAYGPYEPPRKIYTRLVRTFALERKAEFTIRGDGRNLIDAMFIEDAVRAVNSILTDGRGGLVVDFCLGEPYSVEELVLQAARVFGIEPRIRKEGEVPEYIEFRPSPAAMREAFGFFPSTPLEEGLQKLARHLQTEKENTH